MYPSLSRRPGARTTAVVALFLLAFLGLSYTVEPRTTAYSCRNFWTCVVGGSRHAYAHALPLDQDVVEHEAATADGTLKYERRLRNAEPETLFLVLNKDAGSWSSDFHSTQRSIYDFVDLLVATKLNLTNAALGILTASEDEYAALKRTSDRLPLARFAIYYRPNRGDSVAYEDRHNPQVQLARRSTIATLRNYLMIRALEEESHIVWIDADVVQFSDGIVQTMIKHSVTNGDVGILTARCQQAAMDNYDKNAWRVGDTPQLRGPIADADHDSASQDLVNTRLMVPELINGTADSDLIPLDSVGATILYIRADLVRQGVSFPHFSAVGTTWSQSGWIGVESEGICYMAKGLQGGGCYLLGGKHYVRHSDWG